MVENEDMKEQAVSMPAPVTNLVVHQQDEAAILAHTSLHVAGMCCQKEVPLVEKLLKPLPGVHEVNINVMAQLVLVDHDDQTEARQLVSTLNAAQLGAMLSSEYRRLQQEPRGFWASLPSWHILLAGLLWLVSMLSLVPEPVWMEHFKWVALIVIVVDIPPILRRAVLAAYHGLLDINLLMALAVAGAIGLGEYFEGAAVVFLFSLSEWLEHEVTRRARDSLTDILSLRPEDAYLLSKKERVPVEEVAVGDMVAIKVGEKIPVDGIVQSGASSVDEASLTGESRPVEKHIGTTVSAGTINLSSYLEVECTARVGDSAVGRLVRLLEQAQGSRSPTEKQVEEFGKVYTPMVVLAAILAATIPFAFGTEVGKEWLYRACVLLVVACPCALIISTPITYLCALSRAAKTGILVKGGCHLETLGRLRVIGMDKTGTLTQGNFRLIELLPVAPGTSNAAAGAQPAVATLTQKQMLRLLLSVEALSSHPMAAALCAAARAKGVTPAEDVHDFEVLSQGGVAATINGRRVRVGSSRVARELGWTASGYAELKGSAEGAPAGETVVEMLARWEAGGGTVGWIGVDSEPVAVLHVADAVRPEAKEAVTELTRLQVSTVMLTGDNEGAAEAVRMQLGLPMARAELLPQDKLTELAKLKADSREQKGTVGMIGDGINDGPALAAADVGIAMGAAGTAVAMETADVALMDSDLRKVAEAVKIGKACRSKIIQNMTLAFVIKFITLALTLTGFGSLWLAISADIGAMLLVVLNGMTLLPKSSASDNAICVADFYNEDEEEEELSLALEKTHQDVVIEMVENQDLDRAV